MEIFNALTEAVSPSETVATMVASVLGKRKRKPRMQERAKGDSEGKVIYIIYGSPTPLGRIYPKCLSKDIKQTARSDCLRGLPMTAVHVSPVCLKEGLALSYPLPAMSFSQSSKPAVALMPTYRRNLSQNELYVSYFLPSRAYGLNDMFARLTMCTSPALVSPLRLRIAWAIMRLRHTLLASQIEMEPGCYDEASFRYTPPASPSDAVQEAGETVGIFDDKTGPELTQIFMDLNVPRRLSSEHIARIDVARHGPVSPGIEEFHFMLMMLHAVNDGLSVHKHVIIPPTEDRLPSPRSKVQKSAWKVDNEKVQRRAIGGHALPRIKSQGTKHVLSGVLFNVEDTTAILARCKSKRITSRTRCLRFAAWLGFAQRKPPRIQRVEDPSADDVHRRQLAASFHPPSPLSSYMSLALGYCNVVLPSFIPPSADPRALFWLRACSAQSQLNTYARNPLLLARSQVMSTTRGLRAKAFAKQDDEADGTLPRSAPQPAQACIHGTCAKCTVIMQ
ncbi:hypothetical protein DFH09DRAFT_1270613 [Mycena vulgaris]|nr:hypothetical protein DFH09DRAFT_1270613 [Mycena vulgaris]